MSDEPKRPPQPPLRPGDGVLRADDPRPQRVPQLPSEAVTRRARRLDDESPTELNRLDAVPPRARPPAATPAFLYVEKGPGQGQLLEVSQGLLVIGRAATADLRLQHPSISRRHAQLRRLGEQFFLKDLDSQNGTFLGRERLEAEVAVRPGDRLGVGSAVLRLRGGRPQGAERETAVVARPAPRGAKRQPPRPALLALAGVAGFACAGLVAFGLMRAFGPVPAPRRAAVAEARPAAPVAAPEAAAPAPTPAPVAAAPAPPPVRPAAARPGAVRPAGAVAAGPAEAVPAPRHREELLQPYQRADAQASLLAARQARDEVLTVRLAAFVQAYDGAEAAALGGNARQAVGGYQRALDLDAQLSPGTGAYGPLLHRKLAQAWFLEGLRLEQAGDAEGARRAFQLAAGEDPSHRQAQERLGAGAPPAPRKVLTPAGPIDAAFEGSGR